MGYCRAFITPFDEEGEYGEEVEVSQFVDRASLGTIKQTIEGNSDYQLGVFTFSNLSLRLNNRTGKFSDVEVLQSIFRYKRADSKLRLTWQIADEPQCGAAICGDAILSEAVTIYEGLINDESFASDAQTQQTSLKVLGYESLFARTLVPFDTIDSGDPISETIYEILNQPMITEVLSVDQDNIVVGLEQNIDSIASLQNKTVKESIDKLLVASNSVLYIKDNTIYVRDRTPTPDPVFTFYGQASSTRVENILDVNDIKNGVARVVNLATWTSTTLASSDDESVTRHGYKKKEVQFEFFTNNTKRENILDAIVTEFSAAKQEFNMQVNLNYDTLQLGILDRITIDYPTVYLSGEEALPILGIAEWGDDDGDPLGALMPEALWSFSVATDEPYKILAKDIDTRQQTITFRLRRI